MREAKVARGRYKCATCQQVFAKKDTQVDHIEPAVSVKDGFINWDTYISRMYPDKEGFQILCSQCHDNKTAIEKEMRKYYKKILTSKVK